MWWCDTNLIPEANAPNANDTAANVTKNKKTCVFFIFKFMWGYKMNDNF